MWEKAHWWALVPLRSLDVTSRSFKCTFLFCLFASSSMHRKCIRIALYAHCTHTESPTTDTIGPRSMRFKSALQWCDLPSLVAYYTVHTHTHTMWSFDCLFLMCFYYSLISSVFFKTKMLWSLVFVRTLAQTLASHTQGVTHTERNTSSHWYIENTWSINRSNYLFIHVFRTSYLWAKWILNNFVVRAIAAIELATCPNARMHDNGGCVLSMCARRALNKNENNDAYAVPCMPVRVCVCAIFFILW